MQSGKEMLYHGIAYEALKLLPLNQLEIFHDPIQKCLFRSATDINLISQSAVYIFNVTQFIALLSIQTIIVVQCHNRMHPPVKNQENVIKLLHSDFQVYI